MNGRAITVIVSSIRTAKHHVNVLIVKAKRATAENFRFSRGLQMQRVRCLIAILLILLDWTVTAILGLDLNLEPIALMMLV